jgi:hypothetical protein
MSGRITAEVVFTALAVGWRSKDTKQPPIMNKRIVETSEDVFKENLSR